MEFSRQDYWRGLPFPSPVDLPDPGIKPASLASPALTGGFFTTGSTWEATKCSQMSQSTFITLTFKMEVFLVLSISFFSPGSLPRVSVGFLSLGVLRQCRLCSFSDEAVNSITSQISFLLFHVLNAPQLKLEILSHLC